MGFAVGAPLLCRCCDAPPSGSCPLFVVPRSRATGDCASCGKPRIFFAQKGATRRFALILFLLRGTWQPSAVLGAFTDLHGAEHRFTTHLSLSLPTERGTTTRSHHLPSTPKPLPDPHSRATYTRARQDGQAKRRHRHHRHHPLPRPRPHLLRHLPPRAHGAPQRERDVAVGEQLVRERERVEYSRPLVLALPPLPLGKGGGSMPDGDGDHVEQSG